MQGDLPLVPLLRQISDFSRRGILRGDERTALKQLALSGDETQIAQAAEQLQEAANQLMESPPQVVTVQLPDSKDAKTGSLSKEVQENLAKFNDIQGKLRAMKSKKLSKSEEKQRVKLQGALSNAKRQLAKLAQPLVDAGDQHFAAKRYTEALESYTSAIAQNPTTKSPLDFSCLFRRCQCLLQLKRYDSALVDASKLVRYSPRNPDVLHLRAVVLCRLEMWESAVADLAPAISLGLQQRRQEQLRASQQLQAGGSGAPVEKKQEDKKTESDSGEETLATFDLAEARALLAEARISQRLKQYNQQGKQRQHAVLLPPNLQLTIFAMLEASDLRSADAACTSWNSVLAKHSDKLWGPLAARLERDLLGIFRNAAGVKLLPELSAKLAERKALGAKGEKPAALPAPKEAATVQQLAPLFAAGKIAFGDDSISSCKDYYWACMRSVRTCFYCKQTYTKDAKFDCPAYPVHPAKYERICDCVPKEAPLCSFKYRHWGWACCGRFDYSSERPRMSASVHLVNIINEVWCDPIAGPIDPHIPIPNIPGCQLGPHMHKPGRRYAHYGLLKGALGQKCYKCERGVGEGACIAELKAWLRQRNLE